MHISGGNQGRCREGLRRELRAGMSPMWTWDCSGWRGLRVKREEPKGRAEVPTGVPREGRLALPIEEETAGSTPAC